MDEASQWEGSILLNHWDGHFPLRRKLSVGNKLKSVGRKLITGNRASQWKRSFLMGRELLNGKIASQWEGCLLVGRELSSQKAASYREESFPVGRQLACGKRASQYLKGSFLFGRNLLRLYI